jgi:hypothetical protein
LILLLTSYYYVLFNTVHALGRTASTSGGAGMNLLSMGRHLGPDIILHSLSVPLCYALQHQGKAHEGGLLTGHGALRLLHLVDDGLGPCLELIGTLAVTLEPNSL